MAEAFAALGIASAILDLTLFIAKVVVRVKELRESARGVPKSLDDLDRQTALLRDVLLRLHAQLISEGADDQLDDSALRKVLDGIQVLIQQVDKLITKLLPKERLGRVKAAWKAIVSVGQEEQIRDIATKLDHYNGILTLDQVTRRVGGTSTSTTERTVPSQPPIFTVPFRRDPHFVGRTAILEELDRKLKENKFVALNGIGGIG